MYKKDINKIGLFLLLPPHGGHFCFCAFNCRRIFEFLQLTIQIYNVVLPLEIVSKYFSDLLP